MRVTRKEFQRLKVEHRIRNARIEETKESENVVRECEAMAEEELWSETGLGTRRTKRE